MPLAVQTNQAGLPRPRVVVGGVPWRKTFLRHHLASQLQDSSEILVLNDHHDGDFTITPLDFFYGEPNYRLYQPTKVIPLGEGRTDWEARYRARPDASEVFDLTGLLQVCGDDPKNRRSVLLEARSGAGKTVAARAAMFDCFHAADQAKPRLAGLLPCPLTSLRNDGEILKYIEDKNRPVPPSVIWECLARAAGLQTGDAIERVEHWLKIGPPLLILADLNPMHPQLRGVVARGLIEFLRSKVAMDVGHRAVVSYRSHAQDETLQFLQYATWEPGQAGGGRIFVRSDLEPLKPPTASMYLRNLRTVEAALTGIDVDEARLAKDVETQVDAVRQLSERFDHGEGSFVSTPLLLYFVGKLGGEGLRNAKSPADLYKGVVNGFLKREEESAKAVPVDFDERAVRLAMGRLALVILAQGAGTTRLEGGKAHNSNLKDLFNVNPTRGFKALIAPEKTLDWVPEPWRDGPYLVEPIEDAFITRGSVYGIGERSFLRRAGDSVGFLHDSFLYYFAACALRYWSDPDPKYLGNTADEPWRESAARWWAESPIAWADTVEMLGGMLSHEDLLGLSAACLVERPVAGLPSLLHRLVRGRSRSEGESHETVLAELEAATLRPELFRWPFCLFNLVANWLSDAGVNDPECERFVNGTLMPLAKTRGQAIPPVIASCPAPRRPAFLDHRAHDASVNLMEVLPDGRLVSADSQDHLVLWDPMTGQSIKLPDLEVRLGFFDMFNAHSAQLLVISDEAILYVDRGGKTTHFQIPKRWKTGSVTATTIENFGSRAKWLQRGDGALLVRGEGNQIIHEVFLNPIGIVESSRELFRHDQGPRDKPNRFAWLTEDRVESWCDSELIVWDAREDRELFRKDFHPWKATHAALLTDGSVVVGTKEGEVFFWDPLGDAAPIPLFSHEERVVSLISTATGWVISASKEKNLVVDKPLHIRAWRPGLDQEIHLNQGNNGDARVQVLADGRVLVVDRSRLMLLDKDTMEPVRDDENLIWWCEYLEPLPGGERFILVGITGITVFDVTSGEQKWIVYWRANEQRYPGSVRSASDGHSFLSFSDGLIMCIKHDRFLPETRSWEEMHRAEQTETLSPTEKLWRDRVACVYTDRDWLIASCGSGNLEILDFRQDRAKADCTAKSEWFDYRFFDASDPESPLHDRPAAAVGKLPDGRLFAACNGKPNRLFLFDPSTGQSKYVDSGPDIPELNDPALHFILPDSRVIFATEDKTCPLIFWDTHTLVAEKLTIGFEGHEVTQLKPLSEWRFVTGGEDGNVIAWTFTPNPSLTNHITNVFKAIAGRKTSPSPVRWSIERLYQHEDSVRSLLVTSEGHIISSDGKDLRQRRPNLSVETLENGEERFGRGARILAELPDNRFLYAMSGSLFSHSLRSLAWAVIDQPGGKLCSPVSLEGGRIAYGNTAGRVKIWSPPIPPVQHRPEPKVARMARLDGNWLAFLHEDGRLSAWNSDTLRREQGPVVNGKVVDMLDADDGSVLLAMVDGQLLGWRRGRASLLTQPPLPAPIIGLKRLSDGRVVSLGGDGSIIELRGRRVLHQHSHPIVAAEAAPGGRLLFADDQGSIISVETSNATTTEVKGTGTYVSAVAAIPGPNRETILGLSDGTLLAQGADGQDWVAIHQGTSIPLRIISINNDEVALLDVDGRVEVVNHRQRLKVREVFLGKEGITSLAAYPDGRLVLGCQDGSLLIEKEQGGTRERKNIHGHPVTHVAVLADGRVVSVDASGVFLDWGSSGNLTRWESGLKITSLSPLDGGQILFGTESGSVKTMNFVPGQSAREIPPGHAKPVTQVAESSDGRLVSLGEDEYIRITSPPIPEISPALITVRSTGVGWGDPMVPLPSGRLLIASYSDPKIVDPLTGGVETLKSDRKIRSVAVDGHGGVVIGADDGTVADWDLGTGVQTVLHRAHRKDVRVLTIQSNGNVISGDDDGTVVVYERGRDSWRVWKTFESKIKSLDIVNGHLIVETAYSPKLHWARLEAAGPAEEVTQIEDSYNGRAVLPDSNEIVLVDYQGHLKLWDLTATEPRDVSSLPNDKYVFAPVMVGLSARRVLLIDMSGDGYLIDLEGGGVRQMVLEPHLQDAVLLTDGRVALTGYSRLFIWNPDGEQTSVILKPEDKDYLSFALRDDGTIVLVRKDGVVVERGPTDTAEREIFRPAGSGSPEGLALLPSGTVVVLSRSRTMATWKPGDNELSDPTSFPDAPRSVARFAAGGIAFGLRNGMVLCLPPPDESPEQPSYHPATWHDHAAEVVAMALLNGGKLATLDAAGNVVARTLNAPGDVALIHEHDRKVVCLLALPGGRLASASEDGTVLIYDPKTNERSILPTYGKIRELRLIHGKANPNLCLLVVLERGPVLWLTI